MFALAKMAVWLLAFSGTVRHGMKVEGWRWEKKEAK